MNVTKTPSGILLTGTQYFDVAQTLDCGQCFRFFQTDDGGWTGVAGSHPLTVRQTADGVLFENIGQEAFDAFWRGYFDLDRDYAAVRESYLDHPVLCECARFAPGIRILRQDAWEALISFIISQNNHIKRIKGIISRLCELAGDAYGDWFAFPTAAALARLNEDALIPLRAGWRSAYILDAARRVSSGELDLNEISKMPLDEARKALQAIHGVGPKVADCVLLYGMARTDAFPMDVWMKRAMQTLFPGQNADDFGGHPGIAQQYIFHYMRMKSLKGG